MNLDELAGLFDTSKRRCHIVGGKAAAVVIGLDLEGRLFTVVNNEVVSRVNREAFLGTCTREVYLNPGGDGLWPAPEGSSLGYEYATGNWRVPPGLTNARFWLMESGDSTATVRAEIDLINAQGLGVPVALERHVRFAQTADGCDCQVKEVIEFLGNVDRSSREVLLAPWSLCQFDCGSGCFVTMPASQQDVWDLYDDSSSLRTWKDGICTTRTDCTPRYQIGLSPNVEWIEYNDPKRGLKVRRTAALLLAGQDYIDIADREPTAMPDGPPIRFSVYSDPSGFMEIEAAGGNAPLLCPGTRLELDTQTSFSMK